MKVTNMTSAKGNKVPNQFIIQDENDSPMGNNSVDYFQSYNTVIAKRDKFRAGIAKRQIWLDTKWQYSKTTSKYLYMFLGMKRKEIETGIKNGSIIVTDLNK